MVIIWWKLKDANSFGYRLIHIFENEWNNNQDEIKEKLKLIFENKEIISNNDKVLDSLVGENILSYAEETFTLFETEASQSDFIDVVSKYDDGFREAKDQEEIQINDD